MGLRNSAQSFQKMLDWVLADMEGLFVYLDDILIFSKSEGEHLKTDGNSAICKIMAMGLGTTQGRFVGQKVQGTRYSRQLAELLDSAC